MGDIETHLGEQPVVVVDFPSMARAESLDKLVTQNGIRVAAK